MSGTVRSTGGPDTAATAAQMRRLVAAHFVFVWRLLRRLGLGEADAEDAAQEVFIVTTRRLAVVAPGKERSFLIGTAIRVASTCKRGLARRREVLDGEAPDPCDSGPDPEQMVAQHRALTIVDEILEAMAPDLRMVFVLFELEEVPMPEVAESLDLPPGTVASRLRRAREAFRSAVRQRRARERFQMKGADDAS